MRVLHINTNIGGGAGAAAIRIHKALYESGVDSHILFLKGKPPKNLHNAHTLKEFMPSAFVYFLDKLNRLLNYRFQIGKQKCFFNSPRSLFRLHKLEFVKSFDIIQLHWVVKFVDIPSFFKKLNVPVVWTMHDMNPFSGGLHYLTDFSEKEYHNLEQKFRKIKSKAYSHAKIGVVSPSLWLLNEAKKSGTFSENSIFVNIKNPINLFKYSPGENSDTYTESLVLFVAEKSGDKRKGIEYLYKAVTLLEQDKMQFVVMGNPDINCPDYVKQIGFIKSKSQMVHWYRKAKVFVIPSIEDNLPNTVVESLSCGTPVVGFDVGGIKEMITDKKNGCLVPAKDHKQLADGIKYVLENYSELSKSAREFAEQNFSYSSISAQYKELYKQLLQ
ncbi:MAG: glycosyltransferase [Bacteroidetes bacterium]|nr:glycosyltransferase [Bacteroidota bacterium]